VIKKKYIKSNNEQGDNGCRDSRNRSIGQYAHDILFGREYDERNQREGDSEAEHDLAEDESSGWIEAENYHNQRGYHSGQSTDSNMNFSSEETVHDYLARHSTDGGRRNTGGQQRNGEDPA